MSRERLSLGRTGCCFFWTHTPCFSPSLGRGRVGIGTRASLFHGAGGAGLRELVIPSHARSSVECDPPVIQGTFPTVLSSLLWTTGLSGTGPVLPPQTPPSPSFSPLCSLWARLPRAPILLCDHFTCGLSHSPHVSTSQAPQLGRDEDTCL